MKTYYCLMSNECNTKNINNHHEQNQLKYKTARLIL